MQGYNGNSQLGDGTTVDKKVPTPVSDGGLWLAVEVGAAFACGIQTNSRLYCWVGSVECSAKLPPRFSAQC